MRRMDRYAVGLAGMLSVAVVAGCFRQDVVTIGLDVPRLSDETCATLIRGRLEPVDGIAQVRFDYESRKVFVTYDTRLLAYKNVQHLLTDLGFEADGRPPCEQGRALLPEACR